MAILVHVWSGHMDEPTRRIVELPPLLVVCTVHAILSPPLQVWQSRSGVASLIGGLFTLLCNPSSAHVLVGKECIHAHRTLQILCSGLTVEPRSLITTLPTYGSVALFRG